MPLRDDEAGRTRTEPTTSAAVRLCGLLVPAALAAVAALHAAWGLGWRWPGGSDRAFAERVLDTEELPPMAALWMIVVALLVAAAMVRAVAVGQRHRLLRLGIWTIAGVLLARGLMGLPGYLVNGTDRIYQRLDLAIYSPLCLLLALGTVMVALGTRRRD